MNESGAELVGAAVAKAKLIHAHWIAYPEMRGALARLHSMGRQTADTYKRHKRKFEADWKAISAIMPDERILRRAGEFTERFSLRGYDSVYLASAESLLVGQGKNFLHFPSFDHTLNDAAAELGLRLLTAD